MGERRAKSSISERRTPEGRESYLVNLAMKRAEEMLTNGTAPAQIISHFLKLGTERAKLEKERIKADVLLQTQKAALVESQKKSEEITSKALEAFRIYSGFSSDEDDMDDEEYYDD